MKPQHTPGAKTKCEHKEWYMVAQDERIACLECGLVGTTPMLEELNETKDIKNKLLEALKIIRDTEIEEGANFITLTSLQIEIAKVAIAKAEGK